MATRAGEGHSRPAAPLDCGLSRQAARLLLCLPASLPALPPCLSPVVPALEPAVADLLAGRAGLAVAAAAAAGVPPARAHVGAAAIAAELVLALQGSMGGRKARMFHSRRAGNWLQSAAAAGPIPLAWGGRAGGLTCTLRCVRPHSQLFITTSRHSSGQGPGWQLQVGGVQGGGGTSRRSQLLSMPTACCRLLCILAAGPRCLTTAAHTRRLTARCRCARRS